MPTEATEEDSVADVAEDVEEEVVRLFFFHNCVLVSSRRPTELARTFCNHTIFSVVIFFNFFSSVERKALTVDHLSRRALSGLVSRNSLHL